jgi:hypothetical protein
MEVIRRETSASQAGSKKQTSKMQPRAQSPGKRLPKETPTQLFPEKKTTDALIVFIADQLVAKHRAPHISVVIDLLEILLEPYQCTRIAPSINIEWKPYYQSSFVRNVLSGKLESGKRVDVIKLVSVFNID